MFRNAQTRLTLAIALFTCVTTGLVLGGIYVTANQIIAAETRSVVEAELMGLADDYAGQGVFGLATAIDRRLDAPSETVYLLSDAQGRALAGNLGDWPPTIAPGGGWVELELFRTDRNASVLVTAAALQLPAGEWLLVGRDASAQRRFTGTLGQAVLFGLGAALVLGLLTAWLLSRLIFSRLNEISGTARDIVSGDLGRRIPIRGNGDELDQLGDTLNDMLGRIEGLVGNLRMTADSLAHDLRSPLTRLREQLRRLEVPGLSDLERARTVRRAEAEIAHILQVLTDLTEISRAEAGLGRAEFQPLSPGQLVEDLVELYAPLAEEHGVTLTTKGHAPDIMGHRALVIQALSNLIENALRFAPKASEVAIEITGGETVELAVIDQGPGIVEAELERVKAPFVTLDQSRSGGHSGLGLALAAAVAALHDGRLDLKNRNPGPGLAVRLTLGAEPPLAEVA